MVVGAVFTVTTYEPDGSVADQASTHNIMCVNGLTVLAQAINWSGIVDQNANMGNAFTLSYLAPVYGAIGTGTRTSADTVTSLSAEVSRNVISGAATAPAAHNAGASWTWQAFFPIPSVTTVISEAAFFVQAGTGAGSGQILDYALISPTVSQSTSQTATLTATFTFGN